MIYLFVKFSQFGLSFLQGTLLNVTNNLSLHHQDAPCRKFELVVIANVELSLGKLMEYRVKLLLIGQKGFPLLLQTIASNFRVDFFSEMRDAFALSFKDYISHIHKMNTIMKRRMLIELINRLNSSIKYDHHPLP